MRIYISLLFIIIAGSFSTYSQHTIKGTISANNQPLQDAHIALGNRYTFSNISGQYSISGINSGSYRISISSVGYKNIDTLIIVNKDLILDFSLDENVTVLQEVVVQSEGRENRIKKRTSESLEFADDTFIRKNLGGSLIQSLERIAGINTIAIGSGQSKPIIRGLGFNRVVVAENGIKHEGQQWGADHGLEIDQYAVGAVKIIKGPLSLLYGSDAIGGVIEIEKPKAPEKHTLGGSLDLTGKSNNDLYGTSFNLYGRKDKLFFDTRITYTDYADYKVPVDYINIYSYQAPLHKNRLRNTAGNEFNLHFNTGYITDNFKSVFYISNLKTESGLFANAHGLEPRNVDTDLHDTSSRDIQNPSQQVNHFKIINLTTFNIKNHIFEIETGYQNNFRQEFSDYIPHGFMPPVYPENLPIQKNLEREYSKNVYSLNFKDRFDLGNHNITAGINTEYQNNNIGGWGFIIPEYKQFTTGVFAYDKITLSSKLLLHLAARYDYGNIKTGNYYDWFTSGSGDNNNLQRAHALSRTFNSLSWGIGLNYNLENWFFRMNAGKSFRMPIAKELASNGVNYHHFSYETGNASLSAEESYQLDLGIIWQQNSLYIEASPFINYFPNYIYLNPTSDFDYLYGAGNQIYQYTENKVLRYGTELKLNYNFTENYSAEIIGEYVYSEQKSGVKKGFTLPFSPPASVLFNFTYKPDSGKIFKNNFAGIDYKLIAKQNKIVPPETKTRGYQIINLSFGTDIKWQDQFISFNFQIQNLLNSKNMNHTSFYRLIGVPEPGRNIILSVKIPFLISKNG